MSLKEGPAPDVLVGVEARLDLLHPLEETLDAVVEELHAYGVLQAAAALCRATLQHLPPGHGYVVSLG